MKNASIVLWFATCLGITAFALRGPGDAPVAAGWILLVLSAPTSLLAALPFLLAFDGLEHYFSISIDSFPAFVRNLAFFVFFSCVGYLQWFVLVPRLFRGEVTSESA